MKSPRITLSIALLLSLPAKVYAADASVVLCDQEQTYMLDDAARTCKNAVLNQLADQKPLYNRYCDYEWTRITNSAYTSVAIGEALSSQAYYGKQLNLLTEELFACKVAALAQLPKRSITETSDAQIAAASSSSSSNSSSWLANIFSSTPKPQTIVQGNWKGTTYFVDGIEHTPAAWQSDLSQATYVAELEERLKQTPALIQQKGNIFDRITMTHSSLSGFRKKSRAYAATFTSLIDIYRESGLSYKLRSKGLINAELDLFKQTAEDRQAARKGDTPEDQKQLVTCLNRRDNLILGTPWTKNCPAIDPGLNLLTALSAKTLEQRTKVHIQLLATMTSLSKELKNAHAQVANTLKAHADYAPSL